MDDSSVTASCTARIPMNGTYAQKRFFRGALCLVVLVGLLLPATTKATSFLLQSVSSGGHGGDIVWDNAHKQLVVTGTIYGHKFWDLEITSNDHTKKDSDDSGRVAYSCFVATIRSGIIYSIQAVDLQSVRNNLLADSPHQSCTHMALLPNYGSVMLAGPSHVTDPLSQDPTQGLHVKEIEEQFYTLLLDDTNDPSRVTSLPDFSVSPKPERTISLLTSKQTTREKYSSSVTVAAITDKESDGVYTAVLHSDTMSSGLRVDRPLATIIAMEDIYNADRYVAFSKATNTAIHDRLPFIVPVSDVQHVSSEGTILWSTNIAADDPQSGPVLISSLAFIPEKDILIVGGSTTGSGQALGAGALSTDWDGFLAKLNPSDGKLITSNTQSPLETPHSARISSQPSRHDLVHAMCAVGDKLYVIGTTDGIIEGSQGSGAFIIKYDVDTFNPIWRRQIPGVGVSGTACAAVAQNDGTGEDLVYVAGVSSNHEVHIGGKVSQSGTDGAIAFVARLSSENGMTKWIQFLDSSPTRDDIVRSLTVDDNGHVVALGNSRTTAEYAATEDEGRNDVFVVTLRSDTGSHSALTNTAYASLDGSDDDEDDDEDDDDDERAPRISIFSNPNVDAGILFIGLPILLALLVIIIECCSYKRKDVNNTTADTSAISNAEAA